MSNQPMSPSDIEVLLHCYHSPVPHPRRDAPAVKEALDWFLRCGMIEAALVNGEQIFMTTARGRAHVNQLGALPWPEPAWQDARGEIIRDPWTGKA